MPDALCFDMYGTLFDTGSVDARMRERVDAPADLVDDVVDLWRRKQLQYSYQVALMDAYRPFWEVTADALDYAIEYYGLDLRATDRDAVLAAYESLAPFGEVVETLERLAGLDDPPSLAILSNGNPEMLSTLAENAGIDGAFDAVISAHEVETFKPHPSVYRNAADRLGLEPGACWLVSSNAWDVAGAAAAGMGTAWINRGNEPAERVGGEATVELDSLTGLSDAI